MTAQAGLFVARDAGGNGTTPKGARLAVAGLLATNADGTVRTGVLYDGLASVVTGAAGMSYNVRAHVAVTKATDANGPVLVPNDGVVNVTTDPAPGSNSRIDIIYVWQKLVTGDGGAEATNTPVFGVAVGTASASPSAPAIPSGALELARATVTSGTTATSGLTFTHAPWTVTSGSPVPVRSAGERTALAVAGAQVQRLDLGVTERYDGTRWRRTSEFAAERGQVLFSGTIAANNVSTVNITFSAGFTIAPLVFAQINNGTSGGILNIARVDTITTTGARIVIANAAGTANAPSAMPVVWEAVQATSASATG